MKTNILFFSRMTTTFIFWGVIFVLLITGCKDDINITNNSTNNFNKEKLVETIIAEVRKEIDDYIACSSFSQFDIDSAKLQEMIMDPGAVELEDLLTDPSTIAWATQFLGGTLEGGIIVIRNVLYFMEEGHTPELFTNGWNGLNCDDSITLQCVSGSATSIVLCTDATPTGVSFSFNDCVRSGNVYNGMVSLEAVPGDISAVKMGFANYTYSADGEISGDVEFDIDSGTAFEISLQAAQELQVISHGGPGDGAPSCASLLGITTLGLTLDATQNTLAMDGRRVTMDGTYSLTTINSDLYYSSDSTCLCPNADAGIEFEFSNPLGRDGETATARIVFEASVEDHLCARAVVTMLDWPTECSFAENASADCGKLSTEKLLSLTLSSLCVPVE
jgi:hypothetical protein